MKIYKMVLIYILLTNSFSIEAVEKKFVSIPFFVKSINPNPNYNSSNFLNDFYIKQIILDLNIGTPPQKVNCILDQVDECLRFVLNNNNKYSINETYFPDLSSSFKFIGMNLVKDYIYFNNNRVNLLPFFTMEKYLVNKNLSYIPKIGLNIPTTMSKKHCVNLISYSKGQKIINELMWTIEYLNDNEGNFIFGDDLTNYNSIKYPKSNVYKMYLKSAYSINFDEIYISGNYLDNNNQIKININKIDSLLNINYGVIIGPNEYKNQIDKIYFYELLYKKICNIDIISYISTNQRRMEYYVYSCDENSFVNKESNYYNKFPSLIFSSKSIEYNFEFTNKDLFIHINNKYYFLIIFQTLTKENDIIWYLGELFYKKYTFSLQFDSKVIEFYLNKNSQGIDNDNRFDDNEINKNIDNSNVKYIIIIIICILTLIILFIVIILVYLYFKKRKKRINELEDDNYEYDYIYDISINDSKK